ncbi:unnamed protein product [Effrenium voratum]|uniref:Uncharacterized protein n=1 Tax=Effrenium voratum TaxID=2562239 RepID=A0AA36IAZ6_9DINO|nr:unnamed protein product [Effrenium voratum]
MSDGPDESGEWQVVTIGVSRKGEMYTNAPDDEYGANPCRDAKIFAEFTKLICFCSEPVVFAEELKSKPEGDASAFEEPEDDYFEHIDEIMPLQMDLREKLAAGATRMKENNIKNMMVYYAGHGESINKERTASCELKLVLEDEVVRAVEKAKLEHVCVIVLLDSCRDELHKSLYQSPPEPSESNTFRFGYFCQFNHRMRTSSLVLAALMHMMLSETEDSEIVMFFTRLKRVLRDITGGRTDMQLPGTLPDQAFFPAKCRKLKLPFERAKVRRVLEDEEYKALRDTFAMYGHCDCIMDNVYQTGVILRQMLEDTKQMVEQDHKSHLPAFKDSAHTLRYLIPQLQRFAKVFHEKKELFLSDWELELGVVRCKSFEEVLQVLEDVKERAEDPVGSSLRPRCPEVVRKCVVEARHTYSSQEGEQWLMSEKHLKDVFKTLSEYFTPLPPLTSSCVIKEEDEQVPKQNRGFIYELTIDIVAAWCVDGIRASSLTAEQLAQLEHLQNHFTKKDTETNKYETKIYIGAGSIWIMLQLPTLDDRTIRSIHKELEAWTQMLRQSGATWHAARLQKVPQAAVPGGLLNWCASWARPIWRQGRS